MVGFHRYYEYCTVRVVAPRMGYRIFASFCTFIAHFAHFARVFCTFIAQLFMAELVLRVRLYVSCVSYGCAVSVLWYESTRMVLNGRCLGMCMCRCMCMGPKLRTPGGGAEHAAGQLLYRTSTVATHTSTRTHTGTRTFPLFFLCTRTGWERLPSKWYGT